MVRLVGEFVVTILGFAAVLVFLGLVVSMFS